MVPFKTDNLKGTGDGAGGADLLAQATAIASLGAGAATGFGTGEDRPLLPQFHSVTGADLHA